MGPQPSLAMATIALMSGLFGCGAGDRGLDSALRVALVDKTYDGPWRSKWATPGGAVVVADVGEAPSFDGQLIHVPSGHQLFLVELNGPKASRPPLRNELARIANVAVVAVPDGLDPNVWLADRDLFMAAVASDPTSVRPELGSELARVTTAAPDQISAAFLEEKLRQLSGADPVTIGDQIVTITERGSERGRALARAWLRQQYEALGYAVTEAPYGKGGVNLVAERAGPDPRQWLVLSSHYDSVQNAGADDNGAGTISALAVARSLARQNLRVGVRVLAFDQEELGLVGSEAYVRQLAAAGQIADIVANVNLEMTAYDSDGDFAFHSIDCNENSSASLTKVVLEVIADHDLPLTQTPACTNASDHSSFWRYQRPAIVLSENFFGGDGNPCYHRTCDRVDNLNFTFMQTLTTAVAQTVAQLVGAP